MMYKKEKIAKKINFQLLLLLLSVGLSSYSLVKGEVAQYSFKENPDLSIGETPEKVCFFGLKSIILGKAQSHYFSSELFEYLKDNPTILKLGSDDKIIEVIYRDEKCRVVIKNEEHLRGFLIPLEKSMNFPLYYRISTIQEEDITTLNTEKKESK